MERNEITLKERKDILPNERQLPAIDMNANEPKIPRKFEEDQRAQAMPRAISSDLVDMPTSHQKKKHSKRVVMPQQQVSVRQALVSASLSRSPINAKD